MALSVAKAREQELQKAETHSQEVALGKQRRFEALKQEQDKIQQEMQRQHAERLQKMQAEAATEREHQEQKCAEKIALAEQHRQECARKETTDDFSEKSKEMTEFLRK